MRPGSWNGQDLGGFLDIKLNMLANKLEKMGACMEGGMVKNLGKKKAATKVGTTLPKRRDDSTRLCSLTSPISWTQIGEKKNGDHTF